MKKIFCILLVCAVLPLSVKAQETNKFWLGGNFGYIVKKQNGLNLTSYKILPEFGYAWSKQWAVGISIGYVHLEESSLYDIFLSSSYRLTTQGIVIAPFIRFSFLQGSFAKLFVDGGIAFSNGEVKVSNPMNETSYDSQSSELGLRPGVAFNVNKHIAIIGKFGFLGMQYQKIHNEEYYTFGLDFDLTQLQIGVNISF